MTAEIFQLSGYYCGVVTTTYGTQDMISETRERWTKEGKTCWVNRCQKKDTSESLPS